MKEFESTKMPVQVNKFQEHKETFLVRHRHIKTGIEFSYRASKILLVAFAWIFIIIRIPLFLVMCWLRLPIALLCELISIPSLFAFIFCWYAFPIPKMLWGIGLLSFSSFALLWLYDTILMALSPYAMIRDV